MASGLGHVLTLAFVCSICPRLCIGATRIVGSHHPAAHASIQQAINAAASGDTILVQPGVYGESIDFLGKALSLISQSGPDVTTIDGSGQDDAVIKLLDVSDGVAIVQGFTITGGRGRGGPPGDIKAGGGIFVSNSSIRIDSNVILRNSARDARNPLRLGYGGGIYLGATPATTAELIGNEIRENLAGTNGGGVGVVGAVKALLTDNQILENHTSYGDGGAIWIAIRSNDIEIRENIIRGNVAGDHGGGLYIGSFSPGTNYTFELTSNLFLDNTATSRSITPDAGGGAWIHGMNGAVRSNTFARNITVSGSPPDGSGLAILSDSQVTLEYNLFALNRPGAALACEPTVTTSIAHNLFWANLPSDVSGAPCSQQVLESNLFADPQFCDSLGGDLSLAASSPALIYPFGPIGAVTVPGCEGVLVVASTWSRIKAHSEVLLALARRTRGTPPAHPTSLPIITIRP